jgi:hypothetical protein
MYEMKPAHRFIKLAGRLRRLHRDVCGATTLEWALLLGAIGIPSYYILKMCLQFLLANYRMMTFINAMPFP